ncbi:YncE family protein [Mycolicibacterium sp. XJ1819]
MADFPLPHGAHHGAVPPVSNDPDAGITALGNAAVGRGPIGDLAAVGGGQVVVSNHADDTVSFLSFLDGGRPTVDGTVAVGGEPFAVAVADDRVYVSTSTWSRDEVTVVDAISRSVIGSYSLAHSVTALAASPDGKRVFAGRTGDSYADVAVIDVTAERVGTIDVATGAGVGIDALEVDPAGKKLYVATTDARGSALVTVNIETARVERAVQMGAPIRGLALGDGTACVLTSDLVDGGAVHVVDLSTGRVANTVDLGIGAPTQLVMSLDKTRAFVVDYDRVIVLCTLTLEIVDTITTDTRPSAVAVDPDGARLYMSDYTGGVTAFSVTSAMPLLYSQFVATDPIVVPEPAELQAVHA